MECGKLDLGLDMDLSNNYTKDNNVQKSAITTNKHYFLIVQNRHGARAPPAPSKKSYLQVVAFLPQKKLSLHSFYTFESYFYPKITVHFFHFSNIYFTAQLVIMDVIKLVFSGSDGLDWFALGTHSLNLETWEHSCFSINMSSGIVKVNSRVGPDIRLISNT